jgi:hypothetical protein
MRSTLTLAPVLIGAITMAPVAKGSDFYPEIRAIIREAELASVNIRFLNDRSNPSGWAGRLYAQAGYLEDAARAFTKALDSPSMKPEPSLWRARVVYGVDPRGPARRCQGPKCLRSADSIRSLA